MAPKNDVIKLNADPECLKQRPTPSVLNASRKVSRKEGLADREGDNYSGPTTRPLKAEGKIYRIAPDGTRHLVASGFITPWGLEFIDGKLWVADGSGEFNPGREAPDGFIAEIRPQ